ncbi:MAG: AraC family transcriptional regulator [Granulosicoccus sp.]|nr:AraC family transcriptional regulator [Granulosicoccus sp.]
MELDSWFRGAVSGVSLLIATHWFLFDRRSAARFGALFLCSLVCYVSVSSPGNELYSMPLAIIFHAGAIFTVVFFWWFTLTLFTDDFRWKAGYWIPLLILAATLPFRDWAGGMIEPRWVVFTHQFVTTLLLLHGVLLAIRDFSEDLVDARRRFRLAFASLVPLVGLAIVVVELGLFGIVVTTDLLLVQAVILLLLVAGFAILVLRPRSALLAPESDHTAQLRRSLTDGPEKHSPAESITADFCPPGAPKPVAPDALSAADITEIQRLTELMESGYYLETGLTVGTVAQQLGIPEHRLRKHINEQLGHRNFSAFLNVYRLNEAKSRLSDPELARVPISTIAFDTGFNSLGPFNRAFRHATGQTPTEFRQQALARTIHEGGR